LKYNQYITILADSCKEAISQMTKIKIENIHIEEIERQVENYPVAHSMAYVDDDKKIHGSFVLAFADELTALMLASAIGEPMGLSSFKEFDNDASDLINEFVNVVVGRAISIWDAQGLSVKFEPPVFQTDLEIKSESVTHAYKIIIDINADKSLLEGASQQFILRVTFSEKVENPLEKMRVLVVEDSRVIRGVIANAFARAGCKVMEAQDGVEGIAKFRSFKPDLTLMDINMPKMGGLDAIAQIRKTDAEAKIIILSSSSKKDEVVSAKTLDVLGYLLKPIQPDDLIKKVNVILSKNLN